MAASRLVPIVAKALLCGLLFVQLVPQSTGHLCYQADGEGATDTSTTNNGSSLFTCFQQQESDVWLDQATRDVEFLPGRLAPQHNFQTYGRLITPTKSWCGRLDSVTVRQGRYCVFSNYLSGHPLAYTFTGPTTIDTIALDFSQQMSYCELTLDTDMIRASLVKELVVNHGGSLSLTADFLDRGLLSLKRASITAGVRLDWPVDQSSWARFCPASRPLALSIDAAALTSETVLALVALGRQCPRIALTMKRWPQVDCNCEFLKAWPLAARGNSDFAKNIRCTAASMPDTVTNLTLSEIQYPVRCYASEEPAAGQSSTPAQTQPATPTASSPRSAEGSSFSWLPVFPSSARVAEPMDVVVHRGCPNYNAPTLLLAVAVILFSLVQLLKMFCGNKRGGSVQPAAAAAPAVVEKLPL